MKHWGEKGIGGGFNKYSERKFLNSNSKAFFLLEVFKIKLTFEEMIKDLGSLRHHIIRPLFPTGVPP